MGTRPLTLCSLILYIRVVAEANNVRANHELNNHRSSRISIFSLAALRAKSNKVDTFKLGGNQTLFNTDIHKIILAML